MKSRLLWSMLGCIFMALLFVSNAVGQQRTFVSGLGSDGNPCTRLAPCRTFSQAISQTNSGGEVVVLDPAGYGPLNISKPLSITAPPGIYAGISAFSGDAIDITAGTSDTVILRGLTINNQGSGGAGIFFNTGGLLHVEGCVVSGFGYGLAFEGQAKLEVHDSIFRGNNYGMYLAPPFGSAQATLDHVQLVGNTTDGLVAGPRSSVTVTNSIASHNGSMGNGGGGFVASGGVDSATLAQLSMENCVATNNNIGILVKGSAFVVFATSTVTTNNIGIDLMEPPEGNFLVTRGNSTVYGNTQNVVGVLGGTFAPM